MKMLTFVTAGISLFCHSLENISPSFCVLSGTSLSFGNFLPSLVFVFFILLVTVFLLCVLEISWILFYSLCFEILCNHMQLNGIQEL